MMLPKFYCIFLKWRYYSLMVAVCLLFILGFTSCHQKNNTSSGYSDAFKPVLDTVSNRFATNRLDAGLHYLDSSFKHISNATIDDKYRAYAFHYVYEYKAKRDNKKALLYADSMLTLVNKSPNDVQYVSNSIEVNFIMGDAYFNMQQYNEAYKHFFEGYAIGKSQLNNEALAEYNYRMGMIMYKTENYKDAAGYFKKSYQVHDKDKNNFNSFFGNQELLDNIALSYKHDNQIDSAIKYFDTALRYIDQNASQFPERASRIEVARGVIYGNKAEVLISKGDYVQATDLLKKSIAINLQPHHDYNDAELAEIKLAKLYYDHNNDDLLIDLLNDMRLQVDTIKNADAAADWNHLMSRYYLRKKEIPTAFNYLETYNTIKDSNIKKLNLLKQSDVTKQLDNFEKQEQIDKLNNENKFQQIYILTISVAAVMILLIVLLVYRNWKRSKKDVLKVNVLNRQINEQNIVLEDALNEIRNNSQEKDRILRAVAHDLRNPLGGIASITTMLANDELTDEQKGLINLVKDTSFNTLELINEILEATNEALVLNLELVDVNTLVSNSVGVLHFKAAEKGQQIFFKPLDKQLELYISREKIGRVISNLISNAIKFSPTGASITVNVTEGTGQLVIAVEDDGIGIPQNMRDQVFNMFTTAQRPGTAGEKSFGLGLSICRQIMEKFDGKIWFESKKDGGTIFFISLPIAEIMKSQLSQEISVPIS